MIAARSVLDIGKVSSAIELCCVIRREASVQLSPRLVLILLLMFKIEFVSSFFAATPKRYINVFSLACAAPGYFAPQAKSSLFPIAPNEYKAPVALLVGLE
jgi:hypothetical protein